MDNDAILTVVQETKIFGQDVHLYKNIDNSLVETSKETDWLKIKSVGKNYLHSKSIGGSII